jgi:hypothetical protein
MVRAVGRSSVGRRSSGRPMARAFGVRWKLARRRTATAPMAAKFSLPVAVLISSGWLPNMDRTANVDVAPYRPAVCWSCVSCRSSRLHRSATAINANGNRCLQWGGDDAVVRRDCLLQCMDVSRYGGSARCLPPASWQECGSVDGMSTVMARRRHKDNAQKNHPRTTSRTR